MTTIINFYPKRKCGGCTLCCTLVPVKDLQKPANTKCKHLHFKGCKIYAQRPLSCKIWSCAWLNDENLMLRRPDRSHYVIDSVPDTVKGTDERGIHIIEVMQVWCDPKYPDAHRDPALRDYIEQRGIPALVRYGNERGLMLMPPEVMVDKQWHETESQLLTEKDW